MSTLAAIREPGPREPRPDGMIGALGGDPGGTAGFFLGIWDTARRRRDPLLYRSWQCDMAAAPELLGWILAEYAQVIMAAGLERFDARRRSAAMRGFSAAAMHDHEGRLAAAIADAGITVTARMAATVKPWATDRRMEAAGLLAATAGMPDHARSAARNCLYTACHDLGLRDPLSRTVALWIATRPMSGGRTAVPRSPDPGRGKAGTCHCQANSGPGLPAPAARTSPSQLTAGSASVAVVCASADYRRYPPAPLIMPGGAP